MFYNLQNKTLLAMENSPNHISVLCAYVIAPCSQNTLVSNLFISPGLISDHSILSASLSTLKGTFVHIPPMHQVQAITIMLNSVHIYLMILT
jgi:hypothetical protein